jgi:hypothetical protein
MIFRQKIVPQLRGNATNVEYMIYIKEFFHCRQNPSLEFLSGLGVGYRFY